MRSVHAGGGSSIVERSGWGRRALAVMAALALTSALPACSGGGGGTTPTPVTQPPAPVKTLLGQGNFKLVSLREAQAAGLTYDAFRVEITTTGVGTLQSDVDWTFASSVMGIALERSPCTFAQADANQCTEVAALPLPAPKPGRLIVNNLPAGNYVLFIVNVGANSESGNWQVYLTR